MASIYDYGAIMMDRDGKVVGRFGPTDKPEEMEAAIKEVM